MTQPGLGTPLRIRTRDGSTLTGESRPGESWYAGARRVLAERGDCADRPEALDLSGDEKWFTCAGDALLGSRPMTRADLPAVVAWLAEPHVARWWAGESRDEAAVERRYGPRIDGDEPTRVWVMELNGRSVGWVQDYRIGDHPEYALVSGHPDAVGIDYAVGARAFVGRGIGTRALWVYLRDVVRAGYPGAATVFAAPDHRNAASLRVLAKLGFAQGVWFDEPEPGGGVSTVVGCTLDVRTVLGLDD